MWNLQSGWRRKLSNRLVDMGRQAQRKPQNILLFGSDPRKRLEQKSVYHVTETIRQRLVALSFNMNASVDYLGIGIYGAPPPAQKYLPRVIFFL